MQLVRPLGFEPRTCGLRVRCSAVELEALIPSDLLFYPILYHRDHLCVVCVWNVRREGDSRVKGTKAQIRPEVWRLRVVTGYDPTTGNPRQASRTVYGPRKAADSELARFVAEVEKGTASFDGTATISAFLDRWLDHIEGQRSPSTVRGYREKVLRVRRDLGHLEVPKAYAQHLDRAYRQWLDKGTSPATVYGIHRVLSAALHQGEKWRVVDRAATELATLPLPALPDRPMVDPATVMAIADAARATHPVLAAVVVAAVVVAATTGIRRGDLCGLRWSDVDLQAGTLQAGRALQYGSSRRPGEGPTETIRSAEYRSIRSRWRF